MNTGQTDRAEKKSIFGRDGLRSDYDRFSRGVNHLRSTNSFGCVTSGVPTVGPSASRSESTQMGLLQLKVQVRPQ